MIDEAPESDKSDGCPHPRKTVNLFGHEKGQTEILNALKSKKYIMHGLYVVQRELGKLLWPGKWQGPC